ncbi:hypothetical protein Hanom_Chr12g01082281 [Helianthus anomalus]
MILVCINLRPRIDFHIVISSTLARGSAPWAPLPGYTLNMLTHLVPVVCNSSLSFTISFI